MFLIPAKLEVCVEENEGVVYWEYSLGNKKTKCEKENDALGLRALCIISIPYFRNKSHAARSKYGRYLIADQVIYKKASPRSRMRMDLYVTTNPSGTRGGGMYRDKFNEGSTCNFFNRT